MRTFWGNSVMECAIFQKNAPFSDQSTMFQIQFLRPDIAGLTGGLIWERPHISHIVCPFSIKEKRRLDALRPLNDNWIGPWTFWIFCPYIEINIVLIRSIAYQGCTDIKTVARLVKTDRGSKNSTRRIDTSKVKLAFACQGMPDLMPMNKVPGM